MPTIATEAMVATSHPRATRAGLRALERGGNAVDAALAAAAILTVAEPTDNGIGGDAFALVWDEGVLYGLNGSGRAPADLGDRTRADDEGPCSVTVPGAVRLWDALATRFGDVELRSGEALHGMCQVAHVINLHEHVAAQAFGVRDVDCLV
ncbi:MAG: gamma-glutamyltransferase, partial [Thermoleophilia bacterium]|nr:gamma-glutamyltransferase [Thermoleophilia bacterium]